MSSKQRAEVRVLEVIMCVTAICLCGKEASMCLKVTSRTTYERLLECDQCGRQFRIDEIYGNKPVMELSEAK